MAAAGRPGRRRRRSAGAGLHATIEAAQPRRRIPAYELLDEEALCALETQADWILDEIGVEFRGDDEAPSRFAEAGSRVEGARVTFDPRHARSLCSTAPSEFRLHGRDPARSFTLGGDHVVLMPGYGSGWKAA